MPFVSGLDLGQAGDFSAWAVLEQTGRRFAVRHLKRWPLGTLYAGVAADLATLTARPPLPGHLMAVDETGVGRAVLELVRQARPPVRAVVVPVTVTAGHQATRPDPKTLDCHVPKKQLVGTLQAALQSGRLVVSAALPEAELLKRELVNFRVKVTAAGNETFAAWREGQHDDLVLAVAMAVWLAEAFATSGPALAGPAGVFGRPNNGSGSRFGAAPSGVFQPRRPWGGG